MSLPRRFHLTDETFEWLQKMESYCFSSQRLYIDPIEIMWHDLKHALHCGWIKVHLEGLNAI